MRRFGKIATALLVAGSVPATAPAGNGVDLVIGVGGEYIGDRQELGGFSSQQDTFGANLSMTLTGQVLDPRFLSFRASVLRAFTEQELTETSDQSTDVLFFEVGARLFTNRLVSVEALASRDDSDTDFPARGSRIGGITEIQRITLDFKPKKLPTDLRLGYYNNAFESKEREPLRNSRDTSWELSSRTHLGRSSGELNLRQSESDLLGGLLRRRVGRGFLNLRGPLGARWRWRALANGSRFESARGQGPFGPASTNLTAEAALRQSLAWGSWEVSAGHQRASSGRGDAVTDRLAAWILRRVAKDLDFDGEVSYLTSDRPDSTRLTQPIASSGLRWTPRKGPWALVVNPRLSYVSTSSDTAPDRSTFSGSINLGARRRLSRGGYFFEGQYVGRQFSLSPLGTDPDAGLRFLSGLEKERRRFRTGGDFRANSRLNVAGELDLIRRERLTAGQEIPEENIRGTVSVRWHKVQLRATYSTFDITEGDFPTRTDSFAAYISWFPWRWLTLDAVLRSDDRTVISAVQDSESAEAGLRFRYAQLSFYARIREITVDSRAGSPRKDRRIWAGVRRNITMRFGDR